VKIKVLQLINSMDPGGAESLLKSFLKHVDTERFEWHLVYFYRQGSFLKNYEADITIHNLSKNGKFSIISLFKLFKFIKNNKFQVIHTHLIQAGILGKLFGKILGVPVITSTRHYEFLPESFYLYRLEDYLSKIINTTTISISQAVSDYMIQAGFKPERISLVLNGVDDDYFKPQGKLLKENNSVVSVGRLTEQKNFSLLIEAVNLIRDKINDIKCYIIGNGPQYEMLKEKIISLELQDRVFLLKAVPNEQIRDLVWEKEIYVSSSIYEGLPISLLEAMALEMPIVACDVGGVKDILENDVNGLLVEPNQPQILADTIIALINNPDNQKKYGKNARQLAVDEFSIKLAVKKTQDLYIELLKSKNIL